MRSGDTPAIPAAAKAAFIQILRLMEVFDEGIIAAAVVDAMRLGALIGDELDYVPLSQTGAELLFEVVIRRHGRSSTVVTSNLAFEEWTSVFGSERLTGALLDRLTPPCPHR